MKEHLLDSLDVGDVWKAKASIATSEVHQSELLPAAFKSRCILISLPPKPENNNLRPPAGVDECVL